MTSPFVIVHGGGTFAGQLAERLGIPRKMIDGRRVTDRETLEVTVMVYAGWVNKTLVARLQALGVNACGLSGCDLDLVQADRREGQSIDWGYVGMSDWCVWGLSNYCYRPGWYLLFLRSRTTGRVCC